MRTTRCPRCGLATVTANSGAGVEIELDPVAVPDPKAVAFVIRGGIAWRTETDGTHVPHAMRCKAR